MSMQAAPVSQRLNNNFNLLRLAFASLVILSHAPELQDGDRGRELLTGLFGTISFGELALDSFFVLSGFLIVQSWQDTPRAFAFLSSRVLRIYPGFILAALLCAFVGTIYGSPAYADEFDLAHFLKGLLRLDLAAPPAFRDTPHPALNGALWTISYEFKFYLLVLALGLGLAARNFGKAWLLIFATSLVVHVGIHLDLWDLPPRVLTWSRFGMSFAAGACFQVYQAKLVWRADWSVVALAGFIALLAIRPLSEPALSVLWGYAILCYAKTGTRLLAFNRLPDVSYGTYLYAWPVNKVMLWHLPQLSTGLLTVAVFVVSIGLGALSWYAVERPCIRFGRQLRGTPAQRPRLQP